MIRALIALFLATAQAREVPVRRDISAGLLQEQLKSAGFQVLYIAGGKVVFADSEKKDPSAIIAAHVYVDPQEKQRIALEELAALAVKIEGAKETAAERRRFMLLLYRLGPLGSIPK